MATLSEGPVGRKALMLGTGSLFATIATVLLLVGALRSSHQSTNGTLFTAAVVCGVVAAACAVAAVYFAVGARDSQRMDGLGLAGVALGVTVALIACALVVLSLLYYFFLRDLTF